MALTGCLTELSLPELLRFLEQGRKTGLLTLRRPDVSTAPEEKGYNIWFYQGRVVDASAECVHPSLLLMLCEQKWLSEQEANELGNECPIYTPIGHYLKTQGIVSATQLEVLFQAKVLQPVCNLFQLLDADFEFEPKAHLPWWNMTGLSVSPTEVILIGLRELVDWRGLKDKLPNATIALRTSGKRQLPSQLQLEAREWLVWEFANGTATIKMIAQQTRLPLQKVQQVAFRLIVVGLAAPVPLMTSETIKN